MSEDSLPDIEGDDLSVGHVSEDDGPPVLPLVPFELPPFGAGVQPSVPLLRLPRPLVAEVDGLDWGDENSPVSAAEDLMVDVNPEVSELSSGRTSCRTGARDELLSQSADHDAVREDSQVSESEKPSVSEPPAKMARTVGDVFADSFVRLADRGLSDVVLPWELPAVSAIFGESSVSSELKMPPLSMRETEVWTPQSLPCKPFTSFDEQQESVVPGDLASSVFKVLSDVDVDAQQSKAVRLAVDKWIVIMRRNRKMHPECEVDPQALEACIGSRAAGTASKRAGSILTFLRWFDTIVGANLDPFTDDMFWRYMQFLDGSQAPPSKASSFLSALRFTYFVMDVRNIPCKISRKCVGAAERMLANLGDLQQAPPLTVAQVRILHSLLHGHDTSDWDRAFAGYCLLCLYARARQSDFRKVAYVDVDGEGRDGYVVIRVKQHKTARAARRVAQLLPILIPLRGIADHEWFETCKCAFEKVGLLLHGHVGAALFRPPLANGVLARRAITAGEVSAFLRLVLQDKAVSSHSLKRTCISWASKAGAKKEVRSCLGRHVTAVEGTEAVYSVELSMGPVRELETVMDAIRQLEFSPDAPRGHMWAFPPQPPSADGPTQGKGLLPTQAYLSASLTPAIKVESSDEEESSSSNSSSESSGSSESPTSPDHVQVDDRVPVPSGNPVRGTGTWVKHSRSGVLHHAYGDNILVCGRPRTAMYVLPSEEDLMNPECRTCKRNM